jgi:hypothetical protein
VKSVVLTATFIFMCDGIKISHANKLTNLSLKITDLTTFLPSLSVSTPKAVLRQLRTLGTYCPYASVCVADGAVFSIFSFMLSS